MKSILSIFVLTSILVGCAHTPEPADQVNTIHAHWMPPEFIDNVCLGNEACATGDHIFLPGEPAEQTFTLTWVFTPDFVSMSESTITGAAWPEEWRLCELLIKNLDLPEMTWRECRLMAHEVMHVFGMWHPQPEHRGSAP